MSCNTPLYEDNQIQTDICLYMPTKLNPHKIIHVNKKKTATFIRLLNCPSVNVLLYLYSSKPNQNDRPCAKKKNTDFSMLHNNYIKQNPSKNRSVCEYSLRCRHYLSCIALPAVRTFSRTSHNWHGQRPKNFRDECWYTTFVPPMSSIFPCMYFVFPMCTAVAF